MTEIIKNGLHFTMKDGTFMCRELVELPQRFEAHFSEEQTQQAIDSFVAVIRGAVETRFATKEERDKVPAEKRQADGAAIFDRVVASIRTDNLNRFERFMFWLSSWWYYNPTIRARLTCDMNKVWEKEREIITANIMPILPEAIREQIGNAETAGVAVGFGHFAIMFSEKDERIRRIITDTQLLEIHDAYGYTYLDVTPDGKPIARCCTSRGGERAFFDGVHLMAHDFFQTCAPKTVMIRDGYKINSTQVTIVNGQLYPLIDTDDAVAKTTGAFMGVCDFTAQQAVDSYRLSEESGSRLVISDDNVVLDDQVIKPIGIFQPSAVNLLDSGFALYDWSEFHEILRCQYDTVMVVDDNEKWIGQCQEALGEFAPSLIICRTQDKRAALAQILERQPATLVLDVHLTPEEEFDGLWIANQLFAREFKGLIMLASSYPEEQLRAMKTLIRSEVVATGKNLDRIIRRLGAVRR